MVAGDEGDILIDTCATETRTRRFLDHVATVRPDSSIRFVVNTHLHGDHTYGNSVLPRSTSIVGHSQMRAGLTEDSIIDGCPPFWSPLPDWGNVGRRLPTVTYDDRLVLHSGSTPVHVVHSGYAAHTSGDSVAFIPAVNTLLTGDLLFHEVTPLALMGSVDGALRCLDWIADVDADAVGVA